MSVIVPVYNAETYVQQALASLRDQALGDRLEVVVVLDAPTDSSAELVADLARADPRFRVLALPHNVGLAGARQAGVDVATGDYVGFLDADDWAEPEAYSCLHRAAIEQAADVAGCAHRRITPSGETVVPHPFADGNDLRAALVRGHSTGLLWFAWRNIYRRSLLAAAGIRFDPRLRAGEDMTFNLHAFGAANRMAVVDEPLLNYRETPDSLTQVRHLPYLAECLQLAYDLKIEAGLALGLGDEFRRDLNHYIIGNTFPRLLVNALAAPDATSPRSAVADVLALPMIRAAVGAVPVRGSGLPKGIQARLALAKARQPGAIARLAHA